MNFYGNRILHNERIGALEEDAKQHRISDMQNQNRLRKAPVALGHLFVQIGTKMQHLAES